MIDFGCHLNFKVNNQVASVAPTSSDRVKFDVADNGATPFAVNVPRWSTALRLTYSDGRLFQNDCTSIVADGPITLSYGSGSCASSIWLGGGRQPPDYTYNETTCPADSSITLADGTVVDIYTTGGRAGTAYADGANVTNNLSTDPDGAILYSSNGQTYRADGASASTSKEEDDSSMMIVVVVAVAALIIVVIIVVVIVKVKNDASNAAPEHGTVSFENPMYDDDGGQKAGGNDNSADGMYDEPNVVGGSDTGGYMDVPAGGVGGGGSGYMDVAPNSGAGESSGYMDVSPENDDGAFGDDYASDNEDI